VLSRVLRTIREQNLLLPGERVLVAVSGGPDSTALLHALVHLAPRLGISLSVACVDHRLRPESADEADTVKQRCRELGLGCAILEVDVAKSRRAHGSRQEAARRARLSVLEEEAVRSRCAKIALGHTADDQAETVLFRIVRGTGIAGLAGIPYRRGRFVRPLLDVRREQVLAFLAKRKLAFFCDPSNANRRYARPRIRHDLLPALARENPRVVDALLGLAKDARGHARPSWRQVLPGDLYLPRRVADTVDRLVQKGCGTQRVSVRDGEIEVRYGDVVWRPRVRDASADLAQGPSQSRVEIRGPGTYRLFGPPALGVEVTRAAGGRRPGGNAACFDPSKIAWPLELRLPRPGDRMSPRFGRGTRKLSDLLIDAKMPRPERVSLPVLCDASGAILFVPGLRPSQVGRPDGETQEWILVRLLR